MQWLLVHWFRGECGCVGLVMGGVAVWFWFRGVWDFGLHTWLVAILVLEFSLLLCVCCGIWCSGIVFDFRFEPAVSDVAGGVICRLVGC